MNIYLSIISVMAVFRDVKGQGTVRGDPYFCAPAGYCPGLPDDDSGGIEPRIVTPDLMDVENSTEIEILIQQVFFPNDTTARGGGPVTPKPGGNNQTTVPPSPGVLRCPTGTVVCFAQGPFSRCGLRKINTPVNLTDGYAQSGAYPWQAYLMGPTGNFVGSGALLSPYHVLTATHKVLEYVKSPSKLVVLMGVNEPASINSTYPNSRAAEIFFYNDPKNPYDNKTLKDDIAIIRLERPINLMTSNYINTICIPPATSTDDTYIKPPRSCIVSGWGQTLPNVAGSVSRGLKQVMVGTTDIKTCAQGFNGTVNTDKYLDKTGGEICAGGQADRDACFQDGGAPLTCGAGNLTNRYTVAGIVIWGKSCGKPGVYGVYTNVPHYRNWIIEKITMKIT